MNTISLSFFPHIIDCLHNFYIAYPLAEIIVQTVINEGGVPFFVGGTVRDWLLKKQPKDYDIEVHCLTLDSLADFLGRYGQVSYEGKSFGVLRLQGMPIDWSLPRSDSVGRKPTVTVNPDLSFADASMRRDLTINAIGIDVKNNVIVDPFNGIADLNAKVLRAPSVQRFLEDPLRLYRVMQFVGRLDMMPDDVLNEACCIMDISQVSSERIAMEFEKLLLLSPSPSLGFRWLWSIGRLHTIVPCLYRLIGVLQRPDYHPEGDVFEHSMQVLDAMALITKDYESNKRLVLLYAALLHDIGKAEVTKMIDGVWRATGHAEVGATLVPAGLSVMCSRGAVVHDVVLLTRYHMHPLQLLSSNAPLSSYKRLAKNLGNTVNVQMLADLVLADLRGRNRLGRVPLTGCNEKVEQFVEQAQCALVLYTPEPPVLRGRDLLGVVSPGVVMGKLLDYAYELQINEGITDKEILKQRIFLLLNK